MKKIILLVSIVFLMSAICLYADELGDFWPGHINICFSADLIGNRDGYFEITYVDDIATTPFEWINELAIEYQIVHLKQMFQVLDKEWNRNGRYPMNTYRIIIKDDNRTDELVRVLSQQKDILFAEKEAIMRQDYTPNDPMLMMQWAIRVIEAEKAWDFEIGSHDVVIGIVDSGIKWNHPDLRENVYINPAELPGITIDWDNGDIIGGDGIDNDGNGFIDDVLGWDFAHEPDGYSYIERNNPYQQHASNQHGTHVSGCAAAEGDNGIGVAGPAYNVKILNSKHSFTNISTNLIHQAYEGVYYCANMGVNIINASWGGGGSAQVANDAVTYAKEHGVLFVTSAGNSNRDNTTYGNFPTNADDAFSVVASDVNDNRASFSNYGANSDVTSPGAGILSTFYDDFGVSNYGNLSGTSMASPIAAGVAALVLSHYPHLSVDELAHRVRIGCDPIDDLHDPFYWGKLGSGRVNPFNSLMFDQIPRVDIQEIEIIELTGDDNTLNPSEQLTFKVLVKNREVFLDALPTTATLTTDFPFVTIINGLVNYDSIDSGESAVSTNPFIIQIHDNCPIESSIPFTFNYLADGGMGINYVFNLPFAIDVTGNKDNWPFSTLVSPTVSTFVFDINQDGENDIIFTTTNNNVHVLNGEKEYLPGFPVTIPTTINQPITILKSGENYEIIVCGSNTIYKINHHGQIVGSAVVSGNIMSSVVAYDLDGNGYECFAIGTTRGFLYLFNNDMTQRENYPISLGSPSTSLPIFIDFNKNGQIDLVANSNNRNIHIIDALTGTHHSNSPIATNVNVISGLVAAQTSDETYLFLVGGIGTSDNMKIMNKYGAMIASNNLNNAVTTFPIIADIKNTGHLNFICTTNNGRLYIYDSYLTPLPGFPVTLSSLANQHPILYDIDNDGNLEVIVCVNDGTIVAVKHDGTIASGFPYYYEPSWQTSPVIADINGNNRLDMIVANSHNLYYLALGIPFMESVYPVHAYSRARNSVLTLDFVADNDISQPTRRVELIGNYPNPFNPSTRISYNLQDAHFQSAKIEIFNIKGQQILNINLNDNDIKNGYIDWNADNQSSGIYLYRLSLDGKNMDVKKAVLLK